MRQDKSWNEVNFWCCCCCCSWLNSWATAKHCLTNFKKEKSVHLCLCLTTKSARKQMIWIEKEIDLGRFKRRAKRRRWRRHRRRRLSVCFGLWMLNVNSHWDTDTNRQTDRHWIQVWQKPLWGFAKLCLLCIQLHALILPVLKQWAPNQICVCVVIFLPLLSFIISIDIWKTERNLQQKRLQSIRFCDVARAMMKRRMEVCEWTPVHPGQLLITNLDVVVVNQQFASGVNLFTLLFNYFNCYCYNFNCRQTVFLKKKKGNWRKEKFKPFTACTSVSQQKKKKKKKYSYCYYRFDV